MKTQLAIAGLVAGVLAIAAGGVAVNAATLNAVPVTDSWTVPNPVADDRGADATGTSGGSWYDPASTASPSPTDSPSAGADDGLPRHSGLDDGVGHEAGDDGLTRHSGADDGVGHDVGDDHGGATAAPAPVPAPAASPSRGGSGSGSSGSSGSGSGSSGSGSGSSGGHGGGDDSGHGGHGGSGRDD